MKLMRWLRWAVFVGLILVVWFTPFPAAATTPTERTFQIEARRFEYNPAILTVNPDDRVTIELTATDVVHGLSKENQGAFHPARMVSGRLNLYRIPWLHPVIENRWPQSWCVPWRWRGLYLPSLPGCSVLPLAVITLRSSSSG